MGTSRLLGMFKMWFIFLNVMRNRPEFQNLSELSLLKIHQNPLLIKHYDTQHHALNSLTKKWKCNLSLISPVIGDFSGQYRAANQICRSLVLYFKIWNIVNNLILHWFIIYIYSDTLIKIECQLAICKPTYKLLVYWLSKFINNLQYLYL